MSASEFLRISFSRIELSAYSRSITVVFESPALTATYRRRLSRQGRGRTLGCLFFKTFYNFKSLSLLPFAVSYEHNAEQNPEHTNTCGCNHNCNCCITSALNVNPVAVGFYSVLCKVAFYAGSVVVQNLSKLLFRNVGILFPNLFRNGNYLFIRAFTNSVKSCTDAYCNGTTEKVPLSQALPQEILMCFSLYLQPVTKALYGFNHICIKFLRSLFMYTVSVLSST